MRTVINQIRFSNGNSVSLRFSDSLLTRAYLSRGDTVLFLEDADLQALVTSTQRKIDVARASLDEESSGSKPELIREAKAKLDFAIQQDMEQKQLTERSRSLFESDLISREEYELAESRKKLTELEIKISRAALSAVEAGENEASLQVKLQEITRLEAELRNFQQRAAGHIITAPFNGWIDGQTTGDTLLSLIKDYTYVALIPIPADKMYRLKGDEVITLSLDAIYTNVTVKISRIDPKPIYQNGSAFYLARAAFQSPHSHRLTNPIEFKIEMEPGLLPAMLLRTIFGWEY